MNVLSIPYNFLNNIYFSLVYYKDAIYDIYMKYLFIDFV